MCRSLLTNMRSLLHVQVSFDKHEDLAVNLETQVSNR